MSTNEQLKLNIQRMKACIAETITEIEKLKSGIYDDKLQYIGSYAVASKYNDLVSNIQFPVPPVLVLLKDSTQSGDKPSIEHKRPYRSDRNALTFDVTESLTEAACSEEPPSSSGRKRRRSLSTSSRNSRSSRAGQNDEEIISIADLGDNTNDESSHPTDIDFNSNSSTVVKHTYGRGSRRVSPTAD